ncbi:MAG: carboxypeptidase regulatory-like domain-containing protein [Acidobacteriota bacterium]|jgi:hypothetical protein
MKSDRRFLLPVAIFLAALPLAAQFETATVLGSIRDTSQGGISGAKVILRNTATGVTTEVQADEQGAFELFNVRIGRYVLRAEKAGFASTSSAEFGVLVGARQRVDLEMRVGSINETVTVTDAVRSLETDSSDRGQVISAEKIVNLPLNGRSYADLALLAPGVRPSVLSYTGEGGRPRNASFNVNGLRSSLNNFIIDGVDNNSYGTSNQGFSNQVVQVSPDAVAEFKVVTNNYSAEYGRAGGAIINASVKSGTNEFHGAAWEFLRNTQLNAIGFFQPRENKKPTLVQNQFGGALGGPIRKDKLFAFGNYEGFRRVTTSFALSSIATLEQRQGIFTDTNGRPLALQNPLTGAMYPNGMIPASEIPAFGRKVLSELPAPNRPGFANNYESLPRATQNDDKGDLKIDYYVNRKLNVFGRYSHRVANAVEEASLPTPSGGSSNGFVAESNRQMVFAGTYTLDPSSLLDVRFGASQSNGGRRPLDIGRGNMLSLYGIRGLTEDPEYAGGLNTQNIGGYTSLGRQASNPQFQNPDVYNPKVNYSKFLGKLSLKAGYEYQRIHTEIQDFTPQYGRDSYSGQFTRPATAAANSVYNMADFLLGLRGNYDAANVLVAQYRQQMQFFYLQTDWKVNKALTLNLGVRYEFATPQYEAENRLSNFDPQARRLVPASEGSIRNRSGIDPDRNNWAPRVGFAYSMTPKTVLRGGFGTSFIHFNRLGGENILSGNIPWVLRPSIAQLPSQGRCRDGQAIQTCFRPTYDGYPAGFLDPANVSTATTRTLHIPVDLDTAYTMSYHFSIQRELWNNFVLDVGYVGNRTEKLMILGDLNQARFNAPGENATVDARRPITGYTTIQTAPPLGFANYNSLQVRLERRYSSGLYLLNSFTYSKALDNAAGHLETFFGDDSRTNVFDLSKEKGVSSYDQTFTNTTSVVWDLPIGKGKKLGASMPAALDYLAGGWRISLINNMASGQPGTLRYNPVGRQGIGSVGVSIRPNVTGANLYFPADQREWFRWLDPTAVAVVPATEGNPFGNSGRGTVRGEPFYQADLGLHKSFPVTERMRLEFRGEAFNLLNTTNFLVPDTNRSNVTYGTVTNTRAARQLQFALKFIF